MENVDKSEIIDTVLFAMNIHIANAEICYYGCFILVNITSNGKLSFSFIYKENRNK